MWKEKSQSREVRETEKHGTCWQSQHPDGGIQRGRAGREAGWALTEEAPAGAGLCGGSVGGPGDVPVNCTELRRRDSQCDQRGVGQEAGQAGWRWRRAGERWDRRPDFTT